MSCNGKDALALRSISAVRRIAFLLLTDIIAPLLFRVIL